MIQPDPHYHPDDSQPDNRQPDTEMKLFLKGNTNYKPKRMTDASVYDLARHYYTFVEIAEYFSVSPTTLEALHGEAFREGKNNAMQKPRMLLNRILQDFADLPEGVFARGDIPIHNLLKAIELHGKKFEGLGSKQTIVHETGAKYDAVESLPIIIERPSE
jgi:hypothetical protein